MFSLFAIAFGALFDNLQLTKTYEAITERIFCFLSAKEYIEILKLSTELICTF